jgi:hypothetical protein
MTEGAVSHTTVGRSGAGRALVPRALALRAVVGPAALSLDDAEARRSLHALAELSPSIACRASAVR